jgi:hypothetical protein
MPLVLVQGVQRMALVPDQCSVQQLVAAALDPPFHDGVTLHRQLRPVVTVWDELSV